MNKIKIADREYELKELPARKATIWRERITNQYGTFFQEILQVMNTNYETTKGRAVIGQLIGSIIFKLGGSIEDIREMVFTYVPDLFQDQEYALDNGLDSEFITAFVEVIKLAYPFGGLTRIMGNTVQNLYAMQKSGAVNRKTSKN